MSMYVTVAQVQTARTTARCLDCCDDNSTGNPLDAVYLANMEDCITRASALIEQAAQSAGYAIPLTGTYLTAGLFEACINLTSGLMGDRRPEFRDTQGRPVYHAQMARGMAWCDTFSEGDVQLENAPPQPTPMLVGSRPQRGWTGGSGRGSGGCGGSW